MIDTETAQRAQREYMQNRAQLASPLEAICILYQVGIDSLNTAISSLQSGDAFSRARAVSRAQDAVLELTASLDDSAGAHFTKTLRELYNYVLIETSKGHTKQSAKAFRDALSILETLSTAWTEVKAQAAEDAKQAAVAAAAADEAASSVPAEDSAGFNAPSWSYSAAPMGANSTRDWSA